MKKLINIALIALGLISQPMAFAMSQLTHASALSHARSYLVAQDMNSHTSELLTQKLHNAMVSAENQNKMPCLENLQAANSSHDCDDCCNLDCVTDARCMTASAVNPFCLSGATVFGSIKMQQGACDLVGSLNLLQRPTIIYHPPKRFS